MPLTVAVPYNLIGRRLRLDVSAGIVGVVNVTINGTTLLDCGLGVDRSAAEDSWITPRALAETVFDFALPAAARILYVGVVALANDSECCLIVDGERA